MSRAVTLANFASGEALSLDETNDRVGIASTTPDATLDIKNTILMDGDAGIITATAFVGDGSSLTGVANTDYVVGIALTMVSVNVSGSATVDGQLSVGGTITYEDVTNVDSVGVVTARVGMKVLAGGINAVGVVTATSFKGDGSALTGIAATDNIAAASLTVSGITTYYGDIQLQNGVGVGNSVTWDTSANSLLFKDNSKTVFGDGSDLSIYHDTTNTQIHNTTGTLRIRGDSIKLNNAAATKNAIVCENDSVELYDDNIKRLETTDAGIEISHTGTAHTVRVNSGGSVGVGIGVTTTTGRNAAAGVGTVTGQIVFNETTGRVEIYTGQKWGEVGNTPITVTGGTVSPTSRTGYIVHTFSSDGTFETDGDLDNVEIFLCGGGGAGGSNRYGAGGGGGGVHYASDWTNLSAAAYPVDVGAGGGGVDDRRGNSGSDTTFGAPTDSKRRVAKGGGGGGCYDAPSGEYNGSPGGCGGGGTSRSPNANGGSTTQPTANPGVSPSGTEKGFAGGAYQVPASGYAPAGGGGAGEVGQSVPTTYNGGGSGGNGTPSSITGSAVIYGGGGGGSLYNGAGASPAFLGHGGDGGGGQAGTPDQNPAGSPDVDGVDGKGGGGGGAHGANSAPQQPFNRSDNIGGSGGSGVVIIAYPVTQPGPVSASS